MRGGFSSNVWTRWKAISCWSRISASPPFAATTHVISGTTPWTISDILHVQRQPPSLTHSTGRDKGKALQQKSLQSLIFTQSGRRDLNPRPPEPHAGQGNHLKRQLVGFSMASERRRRVPLAEMSELAGRNGTRNSTTRPRNDSAIWDPPDADY